MILAGLCVLYLGILCAANAFLHTKEVCYENVGCFDRDDPHHNTMGHLPQSPEKVKPKFLLFTRENRTSGEPLVYMNPGTVRDSSFDPSRGTKFIIHGFLSDIEKPWIFEMKDALLEQGDYNVICVGWGDGARGPNYLQAASNVRLMGEMLARTIRVLKEEGQNLADVHLIGHSLGSHIAGAAGLSLNGSIGRITGLDPAAPFFQRYSIDVRLDPSDALFVDVIHSNGEPSPFGGFGVSKPVGDVDFYPNDGKHQPGCLAGGITKATSLVMKKLLSAKFTPISDLKGGILGLICSHARAHQIFIESIKASACSFTAIPCDNFSEYKKGKCSTCGERGCNAAGLKASPEKALGTQYFVTERKSPYCCATFIITVKFGLAPTAVRGSIQVSLHGEKGSTSHAVLQAGLIVHGPLGSIRSVVAFDKDVGQVHFMTVAVVPENPEATSTRVVVGLVAAQRIPGDMIYKSPINTQRVSVGKPVTWTLA